MSLKYMHFVNCNFFEFQFQLNLNKAVWNPEDVDF